jgi:hypothetical protein
VTIATLKSSRTGQQLVASVLLAVLLGGVAVVDPMPV